MVNPNWFGIFMLADKSAKLGKAKWLFHLSPLGTGTEPKPKLMCAIALAAQAGVTLTFNRTITQQLN